ncbi:hypothetical protein BHM03_00042704, partial [Ensete ventricosum]
DFATELASEPGKLHELPRLGAMTTPPQAGAPGSGLLVTPFAGVPSWGPIVSNLGFWCGPQKIRSVWEQKFYIDGKLEMVPRISRSREPEDSGRGPQLSFPATPDLRPKWCHECRKLLTRT